ncbi:MAG: sel1 repeat family protein, partial [Candidatus Hydrogenedentes bacterium]|nr:sel1 repeat family protein [Candidatus Hydrogenedentota bacterium]
MRNRPKISEESKARLAQLLNTVTVSLRRIINNQDRIILHQEYDNIINNLKFENIPPEKELITLYTEITNKMAQLRLSNDERKRFLEAFEKNKKEVLWEAMRNVQSYSLEPLVFLTSLAQNAISSLFNYRDMKPKLQVELENSLWELENEKVDEINLLWRKWLSVSLSISGKYEIESVYHAVVREQHVDTYLEAEVDPDIHRGLRQFERLSDYDEFRHSFPPFWLAFAIRAEKAGNTRKRNECLSKFFEYHQSILERDPVFGRACLMKVRTILERNLNIREEKVREVVEELLANADKHLDITDGESRIVISALYQKLDYIERAKSVLYVNLDNNVDIEITKTCMESLYWNRDVAESLYPLLAILVGKKDCVSVEDLLKLALNGHEEARADIGKFIHASGGKINESLIKIIDDSAKAGNDIAMCLLGLLYRSCGNLEKAEEWYLKSAEKGDPDAMFNLGVLYKSRGDEKKAEEWYLKSAERGHADAMFNLGVLYWSRGDEKKAEEWYLKSAERGNESVSYTHLT